MTANWPGPSVTVGAVAADVADLAAFVDQGETFVGSLTQIHDRLERARSIVMAQLGVGGTPRPGGDPLVGHPTPIDELIARVRDTNGFVESVASSLRNVGDLARPSPLGPDPTSSRSSAPDVLVDIGALPAGQAGALTWPLYLGAQGSLATATASNWLVRVRKQTFNPRLDGMWVGRRAYPRWQWTSLALDSQHWNPKPYQAASVARWRGVGRWAGRSGTAAVLLSAGWAEWNQSAQDPAMSTSERVGRTATVAASTTAGSWGGVWAGTQAGVAIGTFICPGAGTVIGGFVGGFVGGVAGGQVGAWVGNEIKDVGGDVTEGAVELVGDIGDVGSDALDALSFWD